MARLLYGSGGRLMECLRLCVKGDDFQHGEFGVRDRNDPKAVLLLSLRVALERQIVDVRTLRAADVAAGGVLIALPHMLADGAGFSCNALHAVTFSCWLDCLLSP